MKKNSKILTLIISLSLLYSIALLTVIPPYDSFSALENRNYYFMDSPQTWEKDYILSGSIFNDFETMFTDMIFKRDALIELHSSIQKFLGKKNINHRIIGDDGYIFAVHHPYLQQKFIDQLNHLGEFCKTQDTEFYYALAPTKDLINIDKIPEIYQNDSSYVFEQLHENLNDSVNFIDLKPDLSAANISEPQYYKTDHHWNMNGVFTAYKKIAESMHQKDPKIPLPHKKSDYDIDTFPEIFIGSSGRIVTSIYVEQADDIEIYKPKFPLELQAKSGGVENFHIYNLDQIQEKTYNNDYAVYLNGSQAELSIENNSSTNDETLLVVGISYTPPVTILLAPHFKTIDYIDLRYNNNQSLYDYIAYKSPDKVLILYYSGVFNDDLYTFDQVIAN